MKLSPISFKGQPKNYAVIDKYVSRSAQPQKDDLAWLKEQGVTDVFNFRTMYAPAIGFDEQAEVEKLGMKYHNIPSVTLKPSEEKINKFIQEVDEVISNGGKAHIHCKAGADRTGMYAFIYKSIKNIGSLLDNHNEMLRMGHDNKLYPNLVPWTKDFIKKYLAKSK